MENIKDLTINESEYNLEGGKKGRIAVFMYSGEADPSKILDYAVQKYVGNNGYHELIDANLDNPWMRVILSNINDMLQESFDEKEHKINKVLLRKQ
jgi:hypothetical protein